MSHRFFLFSLLLLLSTPPLRAHASPFERLQHQATEQENALEQQQNERHAAHLTSYETQLNNLASQLQQQGELDQLLVVRKEQQRLQQDRTLPSDPNALHPALRTNAARLQQRQQQTDIAHTRALLNMLSHYGRRLTQLKTSLTQRDQLDQAVAVNDEIARVRERIQTLRASLPPPPEPTLQPPRTNPHIPANRAPLSLSPTLRRALIAHYAMDTRWPGNRIADRSGHNHHAHTQDDWLEPEGKRHGAMRLNGTNQLILPQDPAFLLHDAYTIAFWIRLDKTRDFGKKSWHLVEFKSETQRGMRVHLNPHTTLLWLTQATQNDAVKVRYSSEDLEPDVWYFFTFTCQKERRARIWLNGERISRSRFPGAINLPEDGSFFFGEHTEGLLDEVMIFDQALNENQIRELYQTLGGNEN